MSTDRDLLLDVQAKLDRVLPAVKRMEGVIDLMLTKRATQAELAKKAGCSVKTLWRRRQLLKRTRMLAGT